MRNGNDGYQEIYMPKQRIQASPRLETQNAELLIANAVTPAIVSTKPPTMDQYYDFDDAHE